MPLEADLNPRSQAEGSVAPAQSRRGETAEEKKARKGAVKEGNVRADSESPQLARLQHKVSNAIAIAAESWAGCLSRPNLYEAIHWYIYGVTR